MRRCTPILLVVFLLAGCTTQPAHRASPDSIFSMPARGEFANGEDFYKARLDYIIQYGIAKVDMPAQTRKDVISCSWLAFRDHLTPEEAAAFEAKARGEQELPAPIAYSIDRKVDQTFSDKAGDPASLKAYCPDRAAEFATPPQ